MDRSPRSAWLRTAIVWLCLALAYAAGLSFYKGAMLGRLARTSADELQPIHSRVIDVFRGSFYFYFDEQFLPGIRQNMAQVPHLNRLQIISASGSVLFDTAKPGHDPRPLTDPRVAGHLKDGAPLILANGFQVRILMPGKEYAALYFIDGSSVKRIVLILFLGGLVLLGGLALLLARGLGAQAGVSEPGADESALPGAAPVRIRTASGVFGGFWEGWGYGWGRFSGLRPKFLLTIVLVNVITGAIVFLSLTQMQVREQTQRIQKASLLFSQFSTDKVISDFSNFYYFDYADRFLPEIKKLVATNENLVGLRIISRRTGAVLFDSEQAAAAPSLTPATDGAKTEFPEDVQNELKLRDIATRDILRAGQNLFSVVAAYRNESGDPLFYVEYLYSFQSLDRSIRAIREQILYDLVPSMVLGLLIAMVFAQLLISPIRRLVAAVQQVASGNYDVSVEDPAKDEIGELVASFNTMAIELKKKKELRKYLSDSTYRQVMESSELAPGSGVGGSRVNATVLFSDIRNFVAHCESLEAEEVTTMLNEYFSEMVEVVYKHGGEVDKFIGDALLAVFYASDESSVIRSADPGAPSPAETAISAIHCALEMREKLAEFNQKRAALNKPTIEIGVGITHGEIISGPIGSKDRMDFTVIGDVVNLANRIEKLSKEGKHTKVVFSHHVEEKVRGLVEYRELTREKIRGKEEEVTVYEVVRVKDLRTLVSHLESSDLDLMLRSIETLGQSRNPEAAPYLIRLLGDSNEKIRTKSALAMASLAPAGVREMPEVVDALLTRLKKESSPRVVSVLITAVGRACSGARVLELASFLDSPDDRIVANAVEAIGQSQDPRGVDLILPRLSSRNNRVKANAAMALFAGGHMEVIDTIKPMLMHSDAAMRASAAFALGEVTLLAEREKLLEEWKSRGNRVKIFLAELQECVPMLVSLLKDSEPMVKRQAIIALGKMKDRSSVLPLIDNIDVEKDSKELIQEVANALRAIGSHRLVREVIGRLGQ